VTPVAVLTARQISRILAEVSGRDPRSVRYKALILVLLETGMRRAELRQLDVEDVDLKARVAAIRRGKGGRSRVAVFGSDGRHVPATADRR
jgi:integrase/recombinase XerD